MSSLPRFLALTATVLVAGSALHASQLPTAAKQAEKQQVHALLTELRNIHKLIETAEHDYDGHRAKASHEVHAALKAIEEGHHKANPNPTNPANQANKPAANAGNGNQGANAGNGNQANPLGLTQEQSDAQLKMAMGKIQTLRTALSGSSSPQVLKAAQHLDEANKELKAALSIK